MCTATIYNIGDTLTTHLHLYSPGLRAEFQPVDWQLSRTVASEQAHRQTYVTFRQGTVIRWRWIDYIRLAHGVPFAFDRSFATTKFPWCDERLQQILASFAHV